MKGVSRRSFLKTTATGAGALALTRIIPGTWIRTANAAKTGYFESEFGINSGGNANVGRNIGHCQHADGLTVSVTHDCHQHLLVLGPVDYFVVSGSTGGNGLGTNGTAPREKPDETASYREAT